MRTKPWRARFAAGNPTWMFIAVAKLQGMDRAMLTTMWFLLGEKWV